ncbi:hypothetical protein [Komagataeibacter melaceti]|uniref:hypothetical protein n=1 Tax=Komagataeibacter melaceti TaxID=2766577 RepID=UPI0013149CC4|nr:hypothetical protein [Komagataeibacter melaceti]
MERPLFHGSYDRRLLLFVIAMLVVTVFAVAMLTIAVVTVTVFAVAMFIAAAVAVAAAMFMVAMAVMAAVLTTLVMGFGGVVRMGNNRQGKAESRGKKHCFFHVINILLT